jgi:hypothetical protein
LAPKLVHLKLNFCCQRFVARLRACLRPNWAVIVVGGLSLAAGGCATGDLAMMATIAGGQKIRVPISRNGVELTNEAGIQINTATFTLNADKKIVFVFEFTDSRHRAMSKVRVEDVSDQEPLPMVESDQPKLSARGQWHGESEPLALGDRRLGWMATLSNTLRVFRFTLTLADGQTLVIHQGGLFSAPMKSAVRQALGQNY